MVDGASSGEGILPGSAIASAGVVTTTYDARQGNIGGLIRQQVLRYLGTFQARQSGNSTPSLYDPPRALLDRCGIGADTVGASARCSSR